MLRDPSAQPTERDIALSHFARETLQCADSYRPVPNPPRPMGIVSDRDAARYRRDRDAGRYERARELIERMGEKRNLSYLANQRMHSARAALGDEQRLLDYERWELAQTEAIGENISRLSTLLFGAQAFAALRARHPSEGSFLMGEQALTARLARDWGYRGEAPASYAARQQAATQHVHRTQLADGSRVSGETLGRDPENDGC